jgi:hypothetical protein
MAQVPALLAGFASARQLTAALGRLGAAGFHDLDAFTPYPVEGLQGLAATRRPPLGMVVLLGGLGGFLAAVGVEEFGAAVSYAINIGGRPLSSWPAWVPIAWEIAALWAVAAGVLGVIFFSRLPKLLHPAFSWPDFDHASYDRFLLYVGVADAERRDEAQALLAACDPISVTEVA